MKKRFFRIGIVLAVPLIIVSIIVLKGLFFSPHTNLEDYKMHEKELGKLFDKYEKESETMTEQELISWENQVKQLSDKAAGSLIAIQKDPQQWESYLASSGQPHRPSPLAEPEYTGLAAKSLKEISSDELDAWWQARDEAYNERRRERLRADGIWNEQEIEALIEKANKRNANNPQRQENREKMRNLLLEREDRERKDAEQARQDAEYKTWREENKAWLASEVMKASQNTDDEILDVSEGTPEERIDGADDTSDVMVLPSDSDIDDQIIRLPSENSVDPKSIATGKDTQLPPDNPFDPDVFALSLSKEMSRWRETLEKTYSDVYRLDKSFEDSLPKEARQYFQERQQRLAFEYVNRLHSVLQDTPNEHRADTLRIVRETLSKNLDRDFADSVIKQLQSDSK